MMGPTVFGHGGSGYVLSNAAMNKLLGPEHSQGLAASWDAKMDDECGSNPMRPNLADITRLW